MSTDETRDPSRENDSSSTPEGDSAPQNSVPQNSTPAGEVPPTFAGPAKMKKSRKVLAIVSIAALVTVGLGGQGVAAVALASALGSRFGTSQSGNSAEGVPSFPSHGSGGSGGWSDGTSPTFPGFPGGSNGSDGTGQLPGSRIPGSQSGTGSTETDATAATDAQKVGVVTILTKLGYQNAEAAGTGMILSSNGLILTNNHVVEGSTSIEVTVESTGETYTAQVVGTDAKDDVAVLKLDDASGLTAVKFDTNETTAVGDDVYSVGNASGTGDLVTAVGSVTGINQSITVSSEQSAAGESLSNLIEVDSDVVSGDSGGPLFDDDGEVVGIITAASSGSANITGYAIDIDVVLDIVQQIESGVETDTVQIGLPAFLGIQLANSSAAAGAGVTVGGVIAGTPAATSGLAAGDVITAVDGAPVATSEALSATIAAHEPGDSVQVTFTDQTGATQTVTVTLVAGPAA